MDETSENLEVEDARESVMAFLEDRLHVDGPFSDADTRAAGRALEHLIRYLNRASQPVQAEQALPYPNTVEVTAGSLHAVAVRLEQLLGQLAQRAIALADDPGLYADARGPAPEGGPAMLAMAAGTDLRMAIRPLAAVAAPLLRAGRQLNRLGIHTDPSAGV